MQQRSSAAQEGQTGQTRQTRRHLGQLLARTAGVGGGAGALLAALAACEGRETGGGAPAPSTQPVKLVLSTDWNSVTRKAVMDLMKEEFPRRHPHVSIEHVHATEGGGSAEGYSEKIIAQLAADTVPDVVANWAYVPFASQLADLTRDAPGAGWRKADVVFDAKNQEVDGKLYMLAMSSAVSNWCYNKTLFEEAGLKEPADTWTLDDVLDAARRLTRPERGQYGAMLGDGLWFGWLELAWGAGAGSTGPLSAEMFSAERRKSRLAEAGGPEAYEWYVDLIHKHHVAPTPQEAREKGVSFGAGKVALQPFGLYNSGSLARQIGSAFTWSGMATPLNPRTKKRATDLNAEGFVLPQATRKRGSFDWALRYALSFYSDPVMKMVAEQRGTLPIVRKWIQSPEYLTAPPRDLDVIVRTINDKSIIVGDHQQRHKAFRPWLAAVRAELNKAVNGENTPRPALQAAMTAGDLVLAAEG